MDTETRHNPALQLSDPFDKRGLKREAPDYHTNTSGSTRDSKSTAAMGSDSSSQYHNGPPQKYRYSPAYGCEASGYSGRTASLDSPTHKPDSRKHSQDRHPSPAPQRQSLPSIHEALSGDQHYNHTSAPTTSSIRPSTPPSAPPTSSRSLLSDSYQRDSYQTSRPPRSPPMSHAAQPQHMAHPHLPQDESRNSSFSETRLPGVQQLTEPQSPHHHLGHGHAQQIPRTSPEYSNAQPATHVSHQTFSHPFPSQQIYRSVPAEPPIGQQHRPNGQFTSQNTYSHSASSEVAGGDVKSAIRPAYGESVKRHLDVYDLESALNDVSECSKHLNEFSTHYSRQAHQSHRSGPLPGSTPHIGEIEEMMKLGVRVQDSLVRLREVVLSQQAALAERSKDQAAKVDHTGTGYPGDDSNLDGVKGGGGFAGSDLKKRRGRAAPPGRCHSCNRAETPEWRRGPDGARTLCNACGLHYAKLTRKMGVSKASAIGSSNLRPKSLGASSTG